MEPVRDEAQPLVGIVDDHESSREGIRNLLKSAGYNTVTFESVDAFLDGDHRDEVRCLVLDLDRPGLGSLELQRQLGQMNVSIPIIFVTDRDNLLEAVALKEGAGAILGKPFTYDALLEAVRSALDFPRRSDKAIAELRTELAKLDTAIAVLEEHLGYPSRRHKASSAATGRKVALVQGKAQVAVWQP